MEAMEVGLHLLGRGGGRLGRRERETALTRVSNANSVDEVYDALKGLSSYNYSIGGDSPFFSTIVLFKDFDGFLKRSIPGKNGDP